MNESMSDSSDEGSKGDQADNSSTSKAIVCRICEERIAESCVKDHSKYCVALRQCIIRIEEFDSSLLQVCHVEHASEIQVSDTTR